MARGSFWLLFATSALALAGGAYVYAPELGTLRPNESVIIAPEIAGRLLSIHFEEGNRVAAGDVLVELDPTILRAELAKARSDLTPRAGQQRARNDAGATGHRHAARARRGRRRVPGRPGERRAGRGAAREDHHGAAVRRGRAAPGQRRRLPHARRPRSSSWPTSTRSRSISACPSCSCQSASGQPIRVTVDAMPGTTFEGDDLRDRSHRRHQRARDPPARPGSQSRRAAVPRLFARIRIVVEQRPDSLLVPEAAVVADGQADVRLPRRRRPRGADEVELGQRRPGQSRCAGLRRDDGRGHRGSPAPARRAPGRDRGGQAGDLT
jgi:membrane fusion protein, multidrug efflux system